MSTRIPTPSSDDMYLAAQWLEVYEGAEDAEACKRVAVWLLAKSDAADLRKAAREYGVPVKALRAKVAEGAGMSERHTAAAPELLEALSDLVTMVELTGGEPTQRGLKDALLTKARAAIAKARP